MNKKCYILNAPEGASGVVKFEEGLLQNTILVDIKGFKPLGDNEIFEIYFTSDKNLKKIGSMRGGREKFSYIKPSGFNGVVITRKNFEQEGINVEFWGGEEGSSPKEDAEKILIPAPAELSEEDISELFPEEFTPENYFGGGFRWKRINGYYSMYKYSIIMYVLSLESVYETIGRWGHYLMGIKKQAGTYVSIALPVTQKEENVFGELEEYAYCMNYKDREYKALCVAVDKSGEYFLY